MVVNNIEEFYTLVKNKDFRISQSIVQSILDNIKTDKKIINVLSITCTEDDEVYEITVEKKHFIQTLEENLHFYIREELYEECQDIINAIDSLKNPQPDKVKRGRPKKS
jgi:hypothetical protein